MGVLLREKHPLQQRHSKKGGPVGIFLRVGLFSRDYGRPTAKLRQYILVLACYSVPHFWFTFHAGKIKELRDVLNELSTLNQWYHFGIYLRLHWSTLDAIKKDHADTKECRTQMLIEWQKHVIPTWSAVVKALMGIGRERLASHLAIKYGMLHLHFD